MISLYNDVFNGHFCTVMAASLARGRYVLVGCVNYSAVFYDVLHFFRRAFCRLCI